MAQIELQLTLPRDSRYVGLLRTVSESLLHGLNVPRESIDDVALALSEACGNVIKHATGSTEYGVQLSVADTHCTVEVCDLGPGFDPADIEDMPDELDDVPGAEGGRGFPLIEALMDELQFVREYDTTTVRLIKRWDAVGLEYLAE